MNLVSSTWDMNKKKEKQLSKTMKSSRPNRQLKKRALSIHVSSRWYRAPEVCLVEKQYDQA